MKKIFYLFLIGLFFLLPRNVFAESIDNVSYKPQYVLATSWQGVQKRFETILNSGGTIRTDFSGSDFGQEAIPISKATFPIDLARKIDFSKYSFILISLGFSTTPVQLDSTLGTCIPFSGSTISATYVCPVGDSSTLDYLYFTAIFENTISVSMYFGNNITLIGKDATSNDVSSAINKQTIEITDAINEQNKTQQETNQKIDDLNNNITSSDTTEASNSADEFFSGFESDDFGLSSIITAPLNLIKSITSSTCTPIGFKAPFVDQKVTLPCMNAIYREHFGSFLTIYQTITFGMIAYWVSVKIFFMVKGFKDPDSDRIEVLDL